MNSIVRKTVWLSLFGAALVTLPATSLFAIQQNPELVLEFPAGNSVGVVTVSDPYRYEGNQLTFDQAAREVYQAHGRVAVPMDGFIELELSEKLAEDLSFLTTLQPNALHSIKINGAKLGKAEMERLVEVKTLVKLELSNCEISPDAFDDLPAMPELLSLHIAQWDANAVSLPISIAKWIAKLPKLETLYSNPTPDVEALSAIGAHPTLAWIYVELGVDSKELLESLSNLPSLTGLSFSVIADVDAESLHGLTKLDQLERLRWFYGLVPGEVLRGLSKNDRLEKLVLAQIEPGEDFSKGIESLSQLTHLEIYVQDKFRRKLKGLATTLLRMPNLVEWPKLFDVNAETLERIVDQAQIEKLYLSGVAKDVTPSHLSKIGKLKNLESLSLEGIKVRDDWLSSLVDLKKLEYLSLWDTGVTGSGLASLDKLPNLRAVHLFCDVRQNASAPPELSSLCTLPALESLQIGGPSFGNAEIEPLRKCKSLKKLRLWGGGFTDDSTAAAIGELQELSELTLSENCVITDVGASALAKLPRLQKVRVGGFVTKAGAMELAKIPSLISLSINSSPLSKEDEAEIRTAFPSIPMLRIQPFSGEVSFGEDGLLR